MTEMKRKSEHSHKPLARYELECWTGGPRGTDGGCDGQDLAPRTRAWKAQPYLGVSSAPDERDNLIFIRAHP